MSCRAHLRHSAAVLPVVLLLLAACSHDIPTGAGGTIRPGLYPIPGGAALSVMLSETSDRIGPELPNQAGRAELLASLQTLSAGVVASDTTDVRVQLVAARNAMVRYNAGIDDVGVLAELDVIHLSLDVIAIALAPGGAQ